MSTLPNMLTFTFRRPVQFFTLLIGLGVAIPAHADLAEITSLRTKAEKGNSIAQYNLGLTYATGRDVVPDLPEAYLWLSLAAANGTTGKALNTLLEEMSSVQLTEGRRLLANYRRLHPPVSKTTAQKIAATAPLDTTSLETVKKQLSRELALAWKEADTLRTQLAEVRNTQKIATAELNTSANELASLRAKVAALQSPQNTHSSNAASILQREVQQLKAAANTLGSDNQKLEDIAAQRGRELDSTRDNLTLATKRINALQHKQDALQRQLDTLRIAKEELRETTLALSAVQTESSDKDQSLNRERGQVTALQQEQAQLQQQLQLAQAQATKLQAKLRSALDDAAQPDPVATAKISELTDQAEALRNLLGVVQNSRAKISSQHDALSKELATTHRELSVSADQIATLRSKVAQLEDSQSNRLTKETDAFQNEIQQLKSHTATLSQLNQKLETVAAQRGRDLAELRSTLQQTNQQLDAASRSITALEQELSAARVTATQPDPEATSQIVELTAEVAGLQEELSQVQAARTDAVAQLESLRPLVTEIGATRAQISSLKDENILLTNRLTEASEIQTQGSTLAAELQAATTSQLAAEEKIQALENELKQEKTTRAITEENYASLTAQLATAQEAHSAMQTQVAAQAAELSNASSSDSSQITALQTELSTTLGHNTSLQEENESLKTTTEQLAAQVTTLETQLASDPTAAEPETPVEAPIVDTAEMDALREQLLQAQEELSVARNDSAALRDRLVSLRTAPTRPGSITATNITRTPVRAPTPVTRTHTVVSGDTLSGISLRYYGTSRRWAEIYEANRTTLPNERSLRIGMSLVIP